MFGAAVAGDVDELDAQALAAGHPDRRHRLGWTPLMAAAANARPRAARRLLRLGADPDAADRYTGRHADAPDRELRRRDFHAGFNPVAGYRGWTALHYAALADCEPAADALLRAGASPRVRDPAGRTPLDLAAPSSRTAALLEEAAAPVSLETAMRRALVGQRGAARAVGAAWRRRAGGWSDRGRPLVLLLVGGSGTGKTETARLVAAEGRARLVRLDMSEYGERHSSARLVGAPPGYVGHEEGGQLWSALRAAPDAVVLLDEADKAHPDVLAVLLQLFDEGRLTNGKGELVLCPDAVFVLTCNLAADVIAEHVRARRPAAAGTATDTRGDHLRHHDDGDDDLLREWWESCGREPGPADPADPDPADPDETEVSRDFLDTRVAAELRRHFRRDELLGRVDEVVAFVPLSDGQRARLAHRELARWAREARRRHGVALRWTRAAARELARGAGAGPGAAAGARALQREVVRRAVSLVAAVTEGAGAGAGAGARGAVCWVECDAEGRLRASLRGRDGETRTAVEGETPDWCDK